MKPSSTNESLVEEIQRGNDPENKLLMELWSQNTGIVKKVCNQCKGIIEEEDCSQECFIAFLDAVKSYDLTKDVPFVNYACDRMKWHVYRQVETEGGAIRIPTYQRQKIRQYLRFVNDWRMLHGTDPDDAVIRAVLNLSQVQLDQLRKDVLAVNVNSIDCPAAQGEEGGATVGDLVPDEDVNVEDDVVARMFEEERRRAVWSIVDTLDKEAQRRAVRLYYRDGLTHAEIGERLGVSGEAVRRTIIAALLQMRREKRFAELRNFWEPAGIYSAGISGGLSSFNRTWMSSTERAAFSEIERQAEWLREHKERQIGKGKANYEGL